MTLPTRFRTLVAAACAPVLLLSALVTAQTAPVIRIIPLGDSITFGSGAPGGYRNKLYQLLTTAGYNVDYVGVQNGNGVGTLPDSDHQGIGGWRIDQVDTDIPKWLGVVADPDVILLHIGTNDFGQGVNTATAIDRWDALITKLATQLPNAHIIATNLMERGEPQNAAIQSQFNPLVQGKINAQIALGRNVTFLDMRAAVPLAEMPDKLHPGQAGYDHMADAWFPAIQAVISPQGDSTPPAISRVRGNSDLTHVDVVFSKPVADSAADTANFAINNGITVSAASLDTSKRIVTLTTSPQVRGTDYTITVNNVVDLTAGPLALPANTTVDFFGATGRGYLNNIPESTGYTLAYTLDVPTAADYKNNLPAYSVNNSASIGEFDRVAYYVELQTPSGDVQYVWASMNSFTPDVGKLAVPTLNSGAIFQQSVSSMNVISNSSAVITGTDLKGNIEFWPNNYTEGNAASVPGASGSIFDYGDSRSTTGNYGSMQLHNAAASQTVFAFNNWGGNLNPGDLDLGIGNNPAPTNNAIDWTFSHNAASYSVRSIQVLVRTTGDTTPPTVESAKAGFGGQSVIVRFSEPIFASSVKAENFTLSNGVIVLTAKLSPDLREVTLITTQQTKGTAITLGASQVRDTSSSANKMTGVTGVLISPPVLPAEITTNVGAAANGYELVYSADLPVVGNFNAAGSDAYRVDNSSALGTFKKVAYYLELQKPGAASQFIWVSMDAFSVNRKKLGVPTFASTAAFQRDVTDMEVVSNVGGITTGSNISSGNLEFWPDSYQGSNGRPAANGGAVPNASATNYDTGDNRSGGNYGSMQIHNHDAVANQTLLAINHFGADGNTLEMGIGNNPAPLNGGVDWTFASNANSYTRRILHVLVLPGVTTDPAIVAKAPEAENYQLVASVNIPTVGNLNNTDIYSLDQRNDVPAFSRIAYYMELKKPAGTSQYIWTSMDAFTNAPSKIGVPTSASVSFFQQNLANMNVFSNVSGVVTGTSITTGNIEFWPSNYQQTKATVSPGNASASTFDFGDSGGNTSAGHGSMQIHNAGASQTLFSITNWGSITSTTNKFGMGIGNNPSGDPDWTFAANSDQYDTRILHVFVLPSHNDSTPPAIVKISPSSRKDRFIIEFSEPLADTATNLANFSIPGLTVTGVRLLPGNKEIVVSTSAQTSGITYTVDVTGVRDRSSLGNLILAGASGTFAGYTVPAVVAGVAETSGYRLMYRMAIPTATPAWNNNTIPYSINESKYGEENFDRVAYLLELDGNYAYASFDPHTNTLSKIGIPTLGITATPFQQKVTNLNVVSNAAGVVNGTALATGNIEFWGGNYATGNGNGILNASGSIFDFGDTMTGGGHGSLQIHNFDIDGTGSGVEGQTILSYSNWGGNTNGTSDLGIGNRATSHPDWTSSNTAGNYATKNLYVLARTVATPPSGNGPAIFGHPTSRLANSGTSTTFSVNSPSATAFQWRKNGTLIQGQTNPWLELAALTAADAGTYDVIVSGSDLSSTISLPAELEVNSPPTFAGYAFTTAVDTPVTVLLAKLIAVSSDIDGDTLTVTAAGPTSAQGGTVSLPAGGVSYSPAAAYTGADSFSITISDGRGLNVVGNVVVTVSSDNGVGANQSGTIIIQPNNSVQGLFFGIPGRSYQIQRSIMLNNDWIVIDTVVADGTGKVEFNDPNPPVGNAFYRTREAP